MPPRLRVIHAAIALIERRGRYLIARRHRDDSHPGCWEFPGGKRERGESLLACLRRELREELGVTIKDVRPFHTLRYRYVDGEVRFRVFRCTIARGTPRPLDAEALRWVRPAHLWRYRFPPANAPLVQRLSRPLSRRTQSGIISIRRRRTTP